MKWVCVNGVWKDYATGQLVEVAPLQLNHKTIPMEVAAEGYKEYSAQFGTQQSLHRLCERGGFGATELAVLLYQRIRRIESPTPETGTAPEPPEPPEKTWECSICGRSNYVTATHCEHCEYSRMVLHAGRLVPRDGYR